jgi:UDP-3-O-[3-hydroxymyristoyl] glucosamine N-acyltransferase
MAMTLGEIAVRYGLDLAGDPTQVVESVAALATATPGALTFCTGAKYRKQLAATRATAVVLPRELAAECPVAALISARPYASYARIAAGLHPPAVVVAGRAPGAQIAPTAHVAVSAWIGPNAVIGAGATIGERCSIGPNCVIEEGVRLGDDCRLQSGVTLCRDVVVGRRCTFKPGAVVGGDGFGFAPDVDGYVKVPHLGSARLGDDVEVGANTTIDRAAFGETVIGRGTKLDNLVMVAHGCRVGPDSLIAAQTGLSGGTTLGRRVMVGGQVGFAGHLTVGDGAQFAAKTGVHGDVPAGAVYGGYPATEIRAWRRGVAALTRLPEVLRRLRRVERTVGLADPPDDE